MNQYAKCLIAIRLIALIKMFIYFELKVSLKMFVLNNKVFFSNDLFLEK